MRMLDNVIDINYYAVAKARNSNLKHRPVGMGIMGFQDCLHLLRTPYASDEAVEFADTSMEAVCYYAYYASTELAQERGRYSSYRGSLWDRGILPQDSVKLLAEAARRLRRSRFERDRWTGPSCVRASRSYGMRNSNCVAIAPTATISNIIGVSACIEPTFQNLYVKSNLSGEFTVVNDYLVRDLKARGLWDEVMVADLKYFDGTLSRIDRIPADLRAIYATAFELDAEVAGRSGVAPSEVDRPGAVAEHLHGRRVGQEARRGLQARVAARSEDDLLPPHDGGDARREVDGRARRAERGAVGWRSGGAGGAAGARLRLRRGAAARRRAASRRQRQRRQSRSKRQRRKRMVRCA